MMNMFFIRSPKHDDAKKNCARVRRSESCKTNWARYGDLMKGEM